MTIESSEISPSLYFKSDFVKFLAKLDVRVDQRVQHVVWHVTNRCNLACSYCFTNSSPFEEKESKEIGMKIATFIGRLKPRQVSIIGGEPLLVPWLPEAIDKIREYANPIINLDTNLSLLTPQIYEKLRDRVDYWNTTLDSYIPSVHNKVRGFFDATVKNIKFLVENGERVKVVVVVGTHNVDHLEEIVDFLQGLGIEEIVLSRMRPVGRGSNAKGLLLQGEVLEEARKRVREIIRKHRNVNAVGWFHESVIEPKTESCYCGRYRITVNWKGEVTPCEMGFYGEGIHFSTFSIEDFYGWALTTSIYPAVCETCPLSERCSKACRYVTMRVTGNPLARPVFCGMRDPTVYDVIGYERFSPIYEEGRERWKSKSARMVERYANLFNKVEELGAGGGVWIAFLEEVLGIVARGYERDPTMLQLWEIYKKVKGLKSVVMKEDVTQVDEFGGLVLMLDNFVSHFPDNTLESLFEAVSDALLIEFEERKAESMQFEWSWKGRTIRERVERLGEHMVRRTFCNDLYCASIEQYLHSTTRIKELLRSTGFSRIEEQRIKDTVYIYAEK